MSTRATYEINGTPFYCHCDGYPSGAAEKLRLMIAELTRPAKPGGVSAIADRRGGATFAFIRGNDDAEPTEGHQAHGDTEYRWNVTLAGPGAPGELLVSCQARRGDYAGPWGAWSTPAPIAGFINGHYPGAVVAIQDPDRYGSGRRLLATTAHAFAIAERELEAAAHFADDNPNKPRHQALAVAWIRGLVEQLPARVAWLERQQLEARAELAKNPTWGRAYYERRLEEIAEELEQLRRPIGGEAELADDARRAVAGPGAA